MAEPKMSYQERLEAEMREVRNDATREYKQMLGKRVIKKQEEALREFFAQWNGYAHSKPQFEQWLLEHGYIEPKTESIESQYAKQAESRCIPRNDKTTLQIIIDATERTDKPQA